MSKRLKNKKHLMYVTTLPCFIQQAGFYTCNGPIQAHHLLKPSDGKRGMSLKAGDDQAIPLCMYHHAKLHTKFGDEFKFFEAYGYPKDAGQKYAKELYDRTNGSNDDLPF